MLIYKKDTALVPNVVFAAKHISYSPHICHSRAALCFQPPFERDYLHEWRLSQPFGSSIDPERTHTHSVSVPLPERYFHNFIACESGLWGGFVRRMASSIMRRLTLSMAGIKGDTRNQHLLNISCCSVSSWLPSVWIRHTLPGDTYNVLLMSLSLQVSDVNAYLCRVSTLNSMPNLPKKGHL